MEESYIQSDRKVVHNMANEGLAVKATARVRLTKLDDAGKVIGIEEHEVELTPEEAETLWHSQQQA